MEKVIKQQFKTFGLLITEDASFDIGNDLDTMICMHTTGDWGEVSEEQKALNYSAIENEEGEIVSHHTNEAGIRFKVLTPEDHSKPTEIFLLDPTQPQLTINKVYIAPRGTMFTESNHIGINFTYPINTHADAAEQSIPALEQISMAMDHLSVKKLIHESHATWHETCDGRLVMIITKHDWKNEGPYSKNLPNFFLTLIRG